MRLLVAAVLLLASSAARADDPTAVAREHFNKGTTLFDLARYREAAAEYEAAYEARNDPALLFNIAQTYRLAGDNTKAIAFYRSYLHRMPRASNRGEVEAKIAELQKAADEQERAKQGPPEGTLKPAEEQHHLDCDDQDANVYHGQTSYFSMPRLHPNPLAYDYDCDGVETKGLQEYNHGCLACTYYSGPQCIDNGGMCSTNAAVNFNVSGFNCGFACPNGQSGYACCGYGPDGFTGAVSCGTMGGSVGFPWTHCTDCPGGQVPGAQTDPNKKQTCR